MKYNFSAPCSLFGGNLTMVYSLVAISIIALASISLTPTSALGQERSRGATEIAETKKQTAERENTGEKKRTQGKSGKRWARHSSCRPRKKRSPV